MNHTCTYSKQQHAACVHKPQAAVCWPAHMGWTVHAILYGLLPARTPSGRQKQGSEVVPKLSARHGSIQTMMTSTSTSIIVLGNSKKKTDCLVCINYRVGNNQFAKIRHLFSDGYNICITGVYISLNTVKCKCIHIHVYTRPRLLLIHAVHNNFLPTTHFRWYIQCVIQFRPSCSHTKTYSNVSYDDQKPGWWPAWE